ncbi:ESX secretion-associated protein EspG [Amycolatopsis anabasis]|uniref:ESX secretion-associated protein EspG n=1 Tax=Amycolatopsis anabasis TaxID=1840409 RepID=UPI00131CC517|nr:ESX secretion-associated protein EspG [Amycolatopsis anabasis]
MIRVSASAFDILWQDLGYPAPPGPLRVRSVGSTDQERADIREAVYDNLAERRLFDGGRLDPSLTESLDTLATATVYVECEALGDMTAEVPLRAVAAARGRRAVLAAQPSKTIGLSSIRDTELFSAIVDLLPVLEPGPGYGISLPASALGSGVEDPVFGERGAASAAYQKQIREVLAIQARPVLGAGQFSVRVREGEGRPRRIGGVSWFATDIGAYLGTLEPGRGGQPWVSVAPVDGPRLVNRLAEILEP